jgi:hypothetical protein
MTPHTPARTGVLIQRIAALAMVAVLAVSVSGGCAKIDKLRKGFDELNHPYRSPSLTDEQKIKLIDSMRANGSFEAARERLTDTAQSIAEQIVAAVPGQTWKFTDSPNIQRSDQQGSLCEELSADIARRPRVTVDFGATFSADDFTTAADILRQAAAEYGATDESSLFNESTKREYDVQGNGYEFRLLQIKFAALIIKGDCFLLQKVLDLPPGQLPPEPPIVPTTP